MYKIYGKYVMFVGLLFTTSIIMPMCTKVSSLVRKNIPTHTTTKRGFVDEAALGLSVGLAGRNIWLLMNTKLSAARFGYLTSAAMILSNNVAACPKTALFTGLSLTVVTAIDESLYEYQMKEQQEADRHRDACLKKEIMNAIEKSKKEETFKKFQG